MRVTTDRVEDMSDPYTCRFCPNGTKFTAPRCVLRNHLDELCARPATCKDFILETEEIPVEYQQVKL